MPVYLRVLKPNYMRMAYTPENAVLKNYVKYISIYEPEKVLQHLVVFPNPGSAISLYKDHLYYKKEPAVYCTLPTPGEDGAMLQVNRIDPVKVIDDQAKEVITIVFYPLGINRFLPVSLADVVEGNGGDPSFIPLKGIFEGFAKEVFAAGSTEEKLKRIESRLLKRLQTRDIPFVAEALELLTDLDSFYSVPEICRGIGTSTRNLTRVFHKHICLSPVEFRNIYRFRYSFERKMKAEIGLPFKDLVYESNYTHSSYMVRMYKKYTGLNPSSFFERVAVEGHYVYISL